MERTGIELEEAVELITAQIHRITDTETVSLPEAAGRVLDRKSVVRERVFILV